MNTKGNQKHKKIAVISSSDAIINPWAMMIKSLKMNIQKLKKFKKENKNLRNIIKLIRIY